MNEKKFTPGPWLSYKLQDDDVINITTRRRKEGHLVDVAFISVGLDKPFDDEQRANAHLIAAAPDMYAALEQIAKICRPLNAPNCAGCLICAALKKARGKANQSC